MDPNPEVGDFVMINGKGKCKVVKKMGLRLRVEVEATSKQAWSECKQVVEILKPGEAGASRRHLPGMETSHEYEVQFPDGEIECEMLEEEGFVSHPNELRIAGGDPGVRPFPVGTQIESSKDGGETWELEFTIKSVKLSEAEKEAEAAKAKAKAPEPTKSPQASSNFPASSEKKKPPIAAEVKNRFAKRLSVEAAAKSNTFATARAKAEAAVRSRSEQREAATKTLKERTAVEEDEPSPPPAPAPMDALPPRVVDDDDDDSTVPQCGFFCGFGN